MRVRLKVWRTICIAGDDLSPSFGQGGGLLMRTVQLVA